MANTIVLAKVFTPILDELYFKESITAFLDAATEPVQSFENAPVVKVYKHSMVGGVATGTWERLTLTATRSSEFYINRIDDEAAFGAAFGKLAELFVRVEVAPETDAYRFAKYASWSGISTVAEAELDNTTVLPAVEVALAKMDNDNVPQEGRILFVSYPVEKMIDQADTSMLANQSRLDGVRIIGVPQGRFYTQITLKADGGYAKTETTGRDINFMLVHPSAVLQATKLNQLRIFDPDMNQEMDAWKMQYRLYHDAFVNENKELGVYLHKMTDVVRAMDVYTKSKKSYSSLPETQSEDRLYIKPTFDTFESFKEVISRMLTHLTGKEYDTPDEELRKDWEKIQRKKAEVEEEKKNSTGN